MKTPEEIKKGLECCAKNKPYPCNGCPYERTFEEEWSCKLHSDALTYIQQLEAQIPKWISVKDRLPKMHDDDLSADAVLVTDGFCMHMAYCIRGEWWFCESGEMKEPMFYNVTHWIPLPEPPKEG